MIAVNQQFQNGLNQPQKQPLFALEIPAYGIVITSFFESDNLLSTPAASGGWGNFLWAVAPWGS